MPKKPSPILPPLPKLSPEMEALQARLKAERAMRPAAPCADQTPEAIEAWLRTHVQMGAEVAVRHTQAGFLVYERARVVRIGRGRFSVDVVKQDGQLANAPVSFYYSGKHCFHPKGQTRLVIPTPAVLAACDVSAERRYFAQLHEVRLEMI